MINYQYISPAGQAIADRIATHGIDFEGNAIVFVGALGICVRKILPSVCDKYSDPAVICIDSTGKYVIPVISGHIGGANELAQRIANILGAQAIITTQSDNMGLWALDTLTDKYGWRMAPMQREEMNSAIATFVNTQPTAMIIEHDDEGTRHLINTCPSHVTICQSYDEYEKLRQDNSIALVIIVSPRTYDIQDCRVIHFIPGCLHLGVGCQHQAPLEVADKILEDIREQGYEPKAIASIGSIELKKNEPCLMRLTTLLPWAKLFIYPSSHLSTIPVPHPSDKVFEVTGCYGVAEGAALAAGEKVRLVVPKQKGCYKCDETTSHYTFALTHGTMHGHIEIVGAGPGDPELISVRGRKLLQQADLILYAGSLVPKNLTLCAKPSCVVRSSADMDLEEQFAIMKEHYDRGGLVVRLHTGDPCIYGAIQEQMAYFDRYGMHYHITPGISSFLAAAAELQSQFTIPERCQTIILTRGEGRTPMPEREKLHMLAEHRCTMCIFLSASMADDVQKQLLEGGYPPDTPVAACYKLTWNDQRIYRGKLCDLAKILKDNHLTLTTMIVVGEAIDNREGLSRLYDGHFTHMFRQGK